ncbi:MAG: hypothetical protein JW841_12105 [Deltaproteobacteria bacterium]|nr:hypothetical protein [Deltaproteobacteria bacterium]
MQKAIIINGRLTNSRTIVLDESINDLQGAVEITLRPVTPRINVRRKDFVDVISSLLGNARAVNDFTEFNDQAIDQPMWSHR